MRHTDFWPWKDSDSPRSRERNTLDHGRYRKRRDINDLCLSEPPWSLPYEENALVQLTLTVASILNLTSCWTHHSPPDGSDLDFVTIPFTSLRNLRNSRGRPQLLHFPCKIPTGTFRSLYYSHCHNQYSIIWWVGQIPCRWCYGQIGQVGCPQRVPLKTRIILNYCKYTWNLKLVRRPHWRSCQPVPLTEVGPTWWSQWL